QRLDQLVPGGGRPAQPVAAHDVAVDAPAAEVAAGGAGVGPREQPLVVPLDGPLHGLVEPLALLPGGALVVGGVAEGDVGPGGEPLDGADEVEVLDLPDEGDGVAGLLAPEAHP